MTERAKASDLIRQMDCLARDADSVTVDDLIGVIGQRGFGPLFLAPALIVLSPLGAIPVVPSLFAALIIVIALQMVLGRDAIWLPRFMRNRSVRSGRVRAAMDKAGPAAAWMDRWFGRRLQVMTTAPLRLAAALVVMALCLSVPALELIPFAAMIPMLAIAVIGLAITVGDGILMLAGLTAAGAALISAYLLLISG